MALSSQHTNLKRWKRKFLGITEEGTTDSREDITIKAQKLINIFRQLSVLNKGAIEHYNEMLLHISPDIRSALNSLPCGSDVRGYISYLQERRGLPIDEDEDEDAEKSEGRKQAEIIAEAISKSTSKTAEQMQEQSLKQVEMLTKTLAEAQNKHASVDDIAKITAAIQAAQANAANAMVAPQTRKVKKKTKDKDGKEIEVEVDEPIPGTPVSAVPMAPMVTGASMAESIGKAVADAIVKSQHQTSEIISKMLADALSKPQQVEQNNLKEISEMLALSQEKTAKLILDNIGDAISKPQQVKNDGLKDLAKMLVNSNEKTIDAISTSIREGISGAPITKDGTGTLDQFANLINSSQDKTAQTILRALGTVIENTPESHSLHEMSKILTDNQEKTAHIITDSLANVVSKEESRDAKTQDTILAMLKAQEESNRIIGKLLAKLAGEKGIIDMEELKQILQKIDETIVPEFTGKLPKLPKNTTSSSDDQPSDIDHDFEYEYYELDDKGNLIPFNPQLNPDVDYEIVDDIEDSMGKFPSYAKKNELLAPDISESLKNIKEKIDNINTETATIIPEATSMEQKAQSTVDTAPATDASLADSLNNASSKAPKANTIAHGFKKIANSVKKLSFAGTKQISAPISGKTMPMPDFSDKPKAIDYDPSVKCKELTTYQNVVTKKLKNKSVGIASLAPKKKLFNSGSAKIWVKNKTSKKAGGGKRSSHPFVIISDGEGKTTLKLN